MQKDLKVKKYAPTPEMRTNPLSKIEGGETITALYDNYQVEYDNIKSISAYIAKLETNPSVIGYIVNNKTYLLKQK